GAGKVHARVFTPVAAVVSLFDDRTGQRLPELFLHAGRHTPLEWEARGATRYRVEATGWGAVRSSESGWLLIDRRNRDLVLERIDATPEPSRPARVAFTRKAFGKFGRAAK